jgi:predicted O-methyltransferase YrrM
LLGLIGGYRISQLVRTAALLNICDRLAAGPRDAADLAAEARAESRLLHRLLRALAGVGVLEEGPDGRFTNTEMGELLRTDVPGSAAGVAAGVLQDNVWKAWGELPRGVVEGATPHMLGNGATFWEVLARDSESSARFNAHMVSQTQAFVPQLLDAFDFSRSRTVIDVGGGNGALIAAILSEHPALRGVLFDRDTGLAGADEFLRRRGVADRCTTVTGNFFESVPAGADTYLLRFVLHDWDDEHAAQILRAVRRAMSPGTQLIVIDHLLPERADRSPDSRAALLIDMHMYVLFGARERTEREMRAMLDAAGFRVERIELTSPARTIVAQAV